MSASVCRRMLICMAAVAAVQAPAHAYLKLGSSVNGRTISLQWPARTPVRYFISDRGVDGVSAPQFREAVSRGFDTWQAVATASVGFEFGGFVGSSPLDQDGANVIGFTSRPDLERTLASTSFLIDTRTGEIVESDIFFNSTFQWSVAPGGEAGRFDVQSIATHESGHFLGLGHSLLGETEPRPTGGRRLLASNSVMFPIAFTAGNIVDRTLTPDDIAGVSDIYPDGAFRQATGSVSGRVVKNGLGVFGAHVVAMHLRTGALVGGFTLDQTGAFVLAGVEPGPIVLRVEPLDDGDVTSFIDGPQVDLNFRVAFSTRTIFIPKGGNVPDVTIEVVGK